MPDRTLRRTAAVFAALLIVAISATGCARKPPCRGFNLLFVVIDTLRADHLGCLGYERDTSPRIDALAKESVLYEKAEAQATWTLSSTATILTGLYPFTHGLTKPSNGPLTPEAITLAERLRNAGYATYGYSANNVVARASGFDQGFERFVTGTWSSADTANAAVVPWVDEAAAGGKPFFLYLHYFDPHHPYDDPAGEFARFGGVAGKGTDCPGVVERLIAGQPAGVGAEDVAALIAHYDGEIRYVDLKLGELLDHVRAKGLLDRTLVVLTADHGEQFLEHGWVRHGSTVFEEETHVPLMFRVPGQPAMRIATRVECADITPTVLDLLGLEPAEELDGVSLARFGRPARPDDVAFSETQHSFDTVNGVVAQHEILTVRRANEKLIEREGRMQLFDLGKDSGEQQDLAAERPEAVRRLQRELEAWKASCIRRSLKPAKVDPRQVQELLERIHANGYLGDVNPPVEPMAPDKKPR